MNIKNKFGFTSFSMVDSPNGTISSVIYTLGCTMRCNYCYNNTLVLPELFSSNDPLYSKEEIKSLILSKRTLNTKNNTFFNKSDYIVLSGGEPLMHYDDVVDFAIYAKSLGFKVKLNTNSSIDVTRLLETKSVDYVSIDFKFPFQDYNNESVQQNFKYIQQSKTKKLINEFEIHTVILKGFIDKETIIKMAEELNTLSISASWYLVGYKHMDTVLDKTLSPNNRFFEPEAKELYQTALMHYNGKVILSGY